MLKIYNTLEEVPEALREHYKKSDGRYVPDLSEDHPVLVHNKTLLSEKTTATNKVKELEADIASASEKSIPRGHVAVKKEDAQLLDQYKALGTPDEVGVIKTEHATLKEKDTQRTREDTLRKVAKAHNYSEDAFILLQNLPDFTSRPSKDGKSTDWFAQVKDDKGVITEKPVKEYVESAEHIKPFMASLTQKSEGVRVPTTGPTTQPVNADEFAWARQFANDYSKTNAPTTNLVDAWNGVNSKPAA